MDEISVWMRIAIGAVSLISTMVGLVVWMWKMLQRQAQKNAEAIERVASAMGKRFDESEKELASVKEALEEDVAKLRQDISHRATNKEIAEINERLSSIEANQRGMNNILGVIHQHILKKEQ